MIIDNINTILAKLKPSQYREYWKKWNDNFRHRYDDIFGNKYRIYLPIDLNYTPASEDEDELNSIESKITRFTLLFAMSFKNHGYPKLYICTSAAYTSGYAYEVKLSQEEAAGLNENEYRDALYNKSYALFSAAKDNRISLSILNSMRKVKIGKALEDLSRYAKNIKNGRVLELLKQAKQEFSTRQTKFDSNKFLVCISRHPYDIAGMSTDRRWTSCMTLPGDKKKPEGGAWREYVYFDITEGTLVAYLIDENDKNITHPFARIAIKPYYNFYDKNDILLVPEPTVYSDRKEGLEPFQTVVKKWVEKAQGRKLGLFKFNKKLYKDTSENVILKYDNDYIHALQKNILVDEDTIRKIITNFPWFIEADVENAVVSIKQRPLSDKLVLMMKSGTWVNGYWVDGFLSKEVIWKNGIWRDGIFNGTWENGVWLDGTWHGKEWKSGEWREGSIISGKYNNTYTRYTTIIDPIEFKKYEDQANTPEELDQMLSKIYSKWAVETPEIKRHFAKFDKYMVEENYKNILKDKINNESNLNK